MEFQKIKSHVKINVSLKVLKKLKSGLHKIESLIFFLNLHDVVLIKKTKGKNHNIKFIGRFSKNISKNNTITKLLEVLDNKSKLNNQKYLIKIIKNIPQKSGMGGGSMNAASVLKYLIKNQNLKINSEEILDITRQIGSDVIIGMNKENSFFYINGIMKKINRNYNLFTLLIMPNFGCSTKEIYKGINKFSKSDIKNKKINLNKNFLAKLRNDLEEPAFKKYPVLKRIKYFMEKIEKILFVRMTGSGSTIIGYFNSKKAALNAKKILKKKYKYYWCILSKTI